MLCFESSISKWFIANSMRYGMIRFGLSLQQHDQQHYMNFKLKVYKRPISLDFVSCTSCTMLPLESYCLAFFENTLNGLIALFLLWLYDNLPFNFNLFQWQRSWFISWHSNHNSSAIGWPVGCVKIELQN